MTENREIKAKALELAIRYLGPRETLTSKELADIKGLFEKELIPVAKIFENLISGESREWGVL